MVTLYIAIATQYSGVVSYRKCTQKAWPFELFVCFKEYTACPGSQPHPTRTHAHQVSRREGCSQILSDEERYISSPSKSQRPCSKLLVAIISSQFEKLTVVMNVT